MDKLDLHSMTERLKQLERENYLFRFILDHISDGVQISDQNLIMIYYNKACEAIENISREDCIGKSSKVIYGTTQHTERVLCLNNVLKNGAPVLGRCNQYLSQGKITNIVASTYPVKIDDDWIGVASILRDTTQVRQYLDEIFSLKRYIHNENKDGLKNSTQYTFDSIIHGSKIMQDTIHLAKKVATNNSNVLIYGETGTGKELFAQSIHNASIFFAGPFIAINCAAIPETLLESLLFGTEKGAFTGALDKSGLFESAENGTLFLDEINSMSINLQSKLLRVLQEKIFRRVGGKTDRKIFCRIITAINKDPLLEIKAGNLRNDLYYRIASVTILIPPLRDRNNDIMLLAKHFVDKFNKIFSANITEINADIVKLFNEYSWPGNVRELEHIVESCMNMINMDDEVLDEKHFPIYLHNKFFCEAPTKKDNYLATCPDSLLKNSSDDYGDGFLKEQLENVEKDIIAACLSKNKGNITKTAKELGIHRQALQYRMRKLNSK
jgi:arginine utilization regulatory protein